MLGRTAYHDPYFLAHVDLRLFGDDTPPRTRAAVLEAMLPYVAAQVARMGRALAARNASLDERSALAWERLALLGDVEAVRERVTLARARDAGFRGAALLDEPGNRSYPLPPLPPRATILAADGSQVYPNPHAAALYYLINVGMFVYHHGTDALPEQITEPQLHYSEAALHDTNGQLITNAAVNARRSVQELALLAREAWARAESAGPLLAISDGPLLFWMDKDVPDRQQLEAEARRFSQEGPPYGAMAAWIVGEFARGRVDPETELELVIVQETDEPFQRLIAAVVGLHVIIVEHRVAG